MPSVRKIKRIVVHCTDTLPTASVAHIMQIFKSRGWRNPGYHYLVGADGTRTPLLSESQIANGAKVGFTILFDFKVRNMGDN